VSESTLSADLATAPRNTPYLKSQQGCNRGAHQNDWKGRRLMVGPATAIGTQDKHVANHSMQDTWMLLQEATGEQPAVMCIDANRHSLARQQLLLRLWLQLCQQWISMPDTQPCTCTWPQARHHEGCREHCPSNTPIPRCNPHTLDCVKTPQTHPIRHSHLSLCLYTDISTAARLWTKQPAEPPLHSNTPTPTTPHNPQPHTPPPVSVSQGRAVMSGSAWISTSQ